MLVELNKIESMERAVVGFNHIKQIELIPSRTMQGEDGV